MDKKYKLTDQNCSKCQEKIIELFDNDISLKSDQSLKNHLKNCPDCQIYLENLTIIKNRLNEPPENKLQPDLRIIKNIISYKNLKQGLKITKPNSVWNSVRELFEYRIPVYQALSGVVVAIMIFFYISGSIVSPGNKAIIIEYSGDYKDLTSSELYLVDTLSLNKPERGTKRQRRFGLDQLFSTDNVMSKILVTTLFVAIMILLKSSDFFHELCS